ncbi:MAG: sodium-translocating pyrophosphatase [Oscillospiraceae bacterium]|jgi:K(+)-stimulated pyrophosphate-energized sodium pump|nr:sodium-translocating pyrophosphatase [Oscillospiraceae bacterium]
MGNSAYYIAAGAAGIVALLFALVLVKRINSVQPGTEKMKEIADAIHEGAMAFLGRQYKVLIIFVIALAAVICLVGLATGSGNGSLEPATAAAFIIGAVCSVLAGNFGMRVATKANVRTANAARESGLNKALGVAFSGGSVMGMCVVGLGLLGLTVVIVLVNTALPDMDISTKTSIINGYALGASSVALFGRVGGGIYTKAADVGADLVGKVEVGIPEDDPRNPAVIADNVGDNVGDVAGMGSDLFESFAGSIIAAIALAAGTPALLGGESSIAGAGLIAPILVAAIGTVASVVGGLFVRTKEGRNPAKALNLGEVVSTVLAVAGIFAVCYFVLPKTFAAAGREAPFTNMGVFLACAAGLLAGFVIGKVTEYYTSADFKPVREIAKSCETGTATNVITGIATGMMSTAVPIIIIVAAILGAYNFAGLYGIAMAAVGMLCTTGMVVAVDAYGPISDNAGGIAEMSGLDKGVREITDRLDAVGNTTAAIGKGFAIGSAALTALALFAAFANAVDLKTIDILSPRVVAGLFIGGMLPFLFSSMTMQAVGRAAGSMIDEVRRQFRNIPGLMEGKAKPEYSKCVDISARAALREMIAPSLIAIIVPIAVGILPFLGKEALGGLLAGTLVTGFLLAVMMSNAGGAWDNAKKYIEEGNHGGKGSDAHAAAVNGDTVGDPFKDTSGPSINILIKLMTIIALVFAPLFM